jgi:hypothetical protein
MRKFLQLICQGLNNSRVRSRRTRQQSLQLLDVLQLGTRLDLTNGCTLVARLDQGLNALRPSWRSVTGTFHAT